MTVHFQDDAVTLHHGDCLDVLHEIPDASIDAIITDPPYGLEFMGKDWDAPWRPSSVGRGARVSDERAAEMTTAGAGHSTSGGPYLAARVDSVRVAGKPFQDWCTAWATECLRVLKPGGHMLAFGGSRTWHRLTCAIEDAGFEVRDSIAWLYGSGFPKSLDVSKALDKAAGAEREVVGRKTNPDGTARRDEGPGTREGGWSRPWHSDVDAIADRASLTAPATEDAARWQGWGTALKPAFEPIVVARKPLAGTVAANVLEHGTGALNIDDCRIATSDDDKATINAKHAGMDIDTYERPPGASLNLSVSPMPMQAASAHELGRWPTNVVFDASQAAELDQQTGITRSRVGSPRGAASGDGWGMTATGAEYDDQGGASRFFPVFRYEAKAPTAERPRAGEVAHPTVKPLDLMRWLVRLVTPPGGTVLDPFAGSGTTAEACVLEYKQCIAIEREADYLPLIVQRITKPIQLGFDVG